MLIRAPLKVKGAIATFNDGVPINLALVVGNTSVANAINSKKTEEIIFNENKISK